MPEDRRRLHEVAVAGVLSRSCRALDDRRHDDLVALFTDDAVFETMGRSLRGRALAPDDAQWRIAARRATALARKAQPEPSEVRP